MAVLIAGSVAVIQMGCGVITSTPRTPTDAVVEIIRPTSAKKAQEEIVIPIKRTRTANLVKANHFYATGRRLYDTKQYAAAIREFEKALRYFPNHIDARHHLKMARNVLTLVTQARVLFRKEKYEDCEKLCLRVLQEDPNNNAMQDLARRARERKHMLAFVGADEQWKQDIERSLQKKVSFEFVDIPLHEALRFLQDLAEAKIIIDQQVMESGTGDTPINLKIGDMSLDQALDWVLRLADLSYALKDDAIFISTPDRLAEAETMQSRTLPDAVNMRPLTTVGDLAAIPFGASVTKFNNLRVTKKKHITTTPSEIDASWYERLGDEKIVDGFPVTFISYGFKKDRLSEVQIYFWGSVKELRNMIEAKYGSKVKRGGVNGGYIWDDKGVSLSFQIYCSFSENIFAFISAKPLE